MRQLLKTNIKAKLFLLHLCKALAAIYRTILSGSERNSCDLAAGSTSSLKHFSLASCAVLSCIAASLAALGFVYESLFSIEFLFTGCEYELISTFLAN